MAALLSRRMLAAVAAGVLLAGIGVSPARADQPSVTGTVTDLATGEPVSGACVTLLAYPANSEVARTCVGDDGGYAFAVPAMGLYQIGASADTYRDLWAPDQLSSDTAGTYFLVPNLSTQSVNFAMFHETGTVSGRVTGSNGAPVESVSVEVLPESATGPMFSNPTYTDADGRYTIADVIPGRYRVQFFEQMAGFFYAPSSDTLVGATVFDLADGASVTADGVVPPPGTVEVTVVDSATGAPLTHACVGGPFGVSTCNSPTGVYRLTDLRPDSVTLMVSAGTHLPATVNVAVVRGETTQATVALTRAEAIVTRVIDRRTNQPVTSVCAILSKVGDHGLNTNQMRHCPGIDGRLVVPLHGAPGIYRLFMLPSNSDYGAQWVGLFGGTGNQALALPIVVGAGANVTIPPIRVDPPGSITGIARNAAGAPVANACAVPFAPDGRVPFRELQVCTDPSGRYTITRLGPYHWPVLFMGDSWVWSGNKSNRFAATKVLVKAGHTATMDAVIPAGATISGNVRNTAGNPVGQAMVNAYNVLTGDYAAPAAGAPFGQPYQLRGLVPQHIRIEYPITSFPASTFCWYEGTTDPWRAKPVRVQSSAAMTLDLTGCG